MSNDIVPSIETLPVELLHRIFDNLDAETILISVRLVSRLFQTVVNTYNRYILDLKLISKLNFYLFYRLINPQNIISLTFSDNEHAIEQIDVFISSNRLPQFTQLRSLTIFCINESQLNLILQRNNFNILTSFSFGIRYFDGIPRETTANLLSLFIEKPSLSKLELNLYTEMILQISWAINCMIQYLTIHNYTNIDFDYLCKIFQYSPHLHTLIMDDISIVMGKNLLKQIYIN
jgi:hypothetical protein